jgi:ABC-type Fe3+/spermidine/putrescine transport system ATPase subunit
MVFQNLALWPHMSARRHIECLIASGAREERRRRTDAVLDDVQFPASARDHRPAELSGGEAQRLALARALANEPDLLLLDEPLAQLDMPLRGEMLALIRKLARDRGMTVIYVTHSWPEVLEICNEAAVLIDGRLEQSGPIDELYFHPASPDVARFTGPVCEIPLECVDSGEIAVTSEGPLLRDEKPSGACYVVRPQQIHLAEPAEPNCWRVAGCRPSGAGWRITLELEPGDRELRIESPRALEVGALTAVHVAPLAGRGEHSPTQPHYSSC